MKRQAIVGLAVGLVLAMQATAADFEAGRTEYLASCAACHGDQGGGDGPYAELLKIASPDLTAIAARRDGKFPVLEMMQIVDGRKDVRGHGGDMPIWGDRYKAEIAGAAGPFSAEHLVRARVLELVLYLQSIQR